MESRPAEAARRSLHEDAKRMTAEQRLAEFLSHCATKVRNSPAPAQAALLLKSMPGEAPVVRRLDARRARARRRGLGGSMAAWAGPTHGLSQRYVNRINGCLDCRPHLRPSVRVPAALRGRAVSDSPGMG
jgi:hypothetical protein